MAAALLRKLMVSTVSRTLCLQPWASAPGLRPALRPAPLPPAPPRAPWSPLSTLSTLLAGAGPPRPPALAAPPGSPCLLPTRAFKTKGTLRKRCKDCYRVKRRGRWFIYCKTNPRHKQRQM